MQEIINNIKDKLNSWSKTAWSNKDIMICLDVGETKASQLHRLAITKNKGIIKLLKNKVKAESVCSLVGVDYNAEIKKLKAILKNLEEDNEQY